MRHLLLPLALGLSTAANAQSGVLRATLSGVRIDQSIADRMLTDPLGNRAMAAFASGLRASVAGGAPGTQIVAAGAASVIAAGAPTASSVTVHLTWPEVTLPTPTGRVRTSVKDYVIYRFDVGAGTAGTWRQVASVPATQHQADVNVAISPAVNGLLAVGLEVTTLTFSTGVEPANGPTVNVADGTVSVAETSNVVRIMTP